MTSMRHEIGVDKKSTAPRAHIVSCSRKSKCELRKACVQDRYARRIDRFFDWNPELAENYVAHPHFEVRAIAAKFVNPFLLPPLLKDPDETVRWEAVRRLPRRYHLELRNDPHREVRIRIASLLEGADLLPMMYDSDYYVRLMVARKVPPSLLKMLINDSEIEVRRVVAQRIDNHLLSRVALKIQRRSQIGSRTKNVGGSTSWSES